MQKFSGSCMPKRNGYLPATSSAREKSWNERSPKTIITRISGLRRSNSKPRTAKRKLHGHFWNEREQRRAPNGFGRRVLFWNENSAKIIGLSILSTKV